MKYTGRVDEQYILTQVNYHYDTESFRNWKDRMHDGDNLYRGNLNSLFPDESALPEISLVENKFKNALHDISRLASEGRGAVKFVPRGEKNSDMKAARVLESINEGYWTYNKLHRRERQLYLDIAGSALMSIAVGYNTDESPYPIATILDPRFCYPDVRGGKLQSMLTIEAVKERIIANEFPQLSLDNRADNQNEGVFVRYWDSEEFAEAYMPQQREQFNDPAFVNRVKHGLGCVPVAFEMLDTYDRGFHGLFEQLAGPLMVRNKTVRFLVDYLEQMAHSPLEERGIENALDEPGPLTVYHHDLTVDSTFIRRVPPGAPSGSVFGLLQYMADQEEKEALQPPARSGNVSQSIASGSFVDRTQGQLTSVVKELQDKMASLREQFDYVCMKLEEKELNFSKPLLRPVAGRSAYTPSEAIDGWYHHEITFGAGAGLDRINGDNRLYNAMAAKIISREEARPQFDFVTDSASSQDKIDREALADALLQRFVRDPATPMSALAQTWLTMKIKGKSLEEALEQVVPQIIAAEQAQQAQGQPPPEELAAGRPPTAPQPELQRVDLPRPPLMQLLGRS